VVDKEYVRIFNEFARQYSGQRRVIMSATAGLVHANHIGALKQSVMVSFLTRGVRKETLSWESDPPEEGESFTSWKNVFKLGSVEHSVMFVEDNLGKLSVFIDGVDFGVRVSNHSGFTKNDYREILSHLGG